MIPYSSAKYVWKNETQIFIAVLHTTLAKKIDQRGRTRLLASRYLQGCLRRRYRNLNVAVNAKAIGDLINRYRRSHKHRCADGMSRFPRFARVSSQCTTPAQYTVSFSTKGIGSNESKSFKVSHEVVKNCQVLRSPQASRPRTPNVAGRLANVANGCQRSHDDYVNVLSPSLPFIYFLIFRFSFCCPPSSFIRCPPGSHPTTSSWYINYPPLLRLHYSPLLLPLAQA